MAARSESLRVTRSMLVSLALTAAAATATSPRAAAQPLAPVPVRGLWLSGGGGPTTLDGFGDAVGLHVQRGGIVASLRRHSTHLERSPFESFSLLAGLAKQSTGPLGAALSAGISHSRHSDHYDLDAKQFVDRTAVGPMVVADVSFRGGSSGGAGIGLSLFVNANPLEQFAGIQVELLTGRWR